MVNYKEYLSSNEWKEIRLQLLLTRGNKCERCGKNYHPRNLHIHHLTYERLGNEEPEDLEVLCRGCHGFEHRKGKSYKAYKKRMKKVVKHKPKKLTKKQKQIRREMNKSRSEQKKFLRGI